MVGEIIGAVGVAIAVTREFFAARERRRARPVVVVHEDNSRTFDGNRGWRVLAHLTNESSATAFNIRFGIEMLGTPFPYSVGNDEASRQNVLAPGQRLPREGSFGIRLPDEAVWAGKGDPDVGRAYWATYQSPSGEWWSTRNPASREADFEVSRVPRNKRRRQLDAERRVAHVAAGTATIGQAHTELLEGMKQDDEAEGGPRAT